MVTGKAGYNLGSPEGRFLASGSGQNSNNIRFTVYYSSSISVSDAGEAVLVSPENVTYPYNSENSSDFQQRIRGKFIKIELQLYVGYPQQAPSGLMFIPTDATLSYNTSGTSLGYPYDYCYIVDKMQIVQPYGVRTTTTYPVSTNPKAYQEGDDAKAAGYVVGEVVTGVMLNLTTTAQGTRITYATSLIVSNDGKLSLGPDSEAITMYYSTGPSGVSNTINGKYVIISNEALDTAIPLDTIIYIPKTATISLANDGTNYKISSYQPVTGYAAIPAGTTIEYLGKLGDKARVQVVSYVGTGTNSSETPNSLVFDFAPKIVFILGWINTNSNFCQGMLSPLLDYGFCMTSGYSGYGSSAYLTVKSSGNKITWTGKDPYYQLNESGAKYYAVAIG